MFFSLLACISPTLPAVDYTAIVDDNNVTTYQIESTSIAGQLNYHLQVACIPSNLNPLTISVGVVSDVPLSHWIFRFSREEKTYRVNAQIQDTYRLYLLPPQSWESDRISLKDTLRLLMEHEADTLIVETNATTVYPLAGLSEAVRLFPSICQPAEGIFRLWKD